MRQRQEDLAARCAALRARCARATRSRGARSPVGSIAAMNALAVGVHEPRALAAQRLRQQEPRLPRHVQRRRMKLDELEIGDARAGVVRDRDAVAGRDRRIRRLAEHLPRAAGREQRTRRARLRRSFRQSSKYRTPTHAPVLDDHPDGARVRARTRTLGMRRDALPEHAADLAARWRRARAARAARCAPPRVASAGRAVGVAIEARRPTRSARARSAGPLRPARATARSSHRPSPAASVSARCSAGLSSGPTAAAMPPCA